MSRYGELLKTLIKFTDIKMSTVADNLGYDVSYISKWCNKSKLPAGRVSNEVNRNLAKLFSDEIINQNELSSFCSVVISEDKLENYLYNALKDAFKKSEGESEAPGRKTTYNTRTLVYQRELSDFFDKELFNILYSSAEPVEMLCTFNIFDYINTSELSDNPIVNSPIHVKLGIATENVSKKDFFSLYNLINKYFNDKVKICDLGTGSGVIGITLKKLNNSFDVTCIDISKKALKVAKKNSIYLNTDVNFINSDMLKRVNDNFDVIISNPPYIKNNTKEIDNIVKKYEPSLALYGGDDGLKYYKEILKTCKKNLNDKSIIAFEIGYDLKEDIINIIKEYFKDSKIICKKDYNDLDRYIFILNNLE